MNRGFVLLFVRLLFFFGSFFGGFLLFCHSGLQFCKNIRKHYLSKNVNLPFCEIHFDLAAVVDEDQDNDTSDHVPAVSPKT